MIAVKIDNPEIENKFKEYAKKQKKSLEDVVSEAMKLFLDINKKNDELIYTKKDPMKHLHKIKYEDDGEDLSDVTPYSYVQDVGKYVHDLRRSKTK